MRQAVDHAAADQLEGRSHPWPTDWRTPDDRRADRGHPAPRRRATRRSGSSATCARSASCTTWPSAGRSSGCSTRACTTRRSRKRTGASTATITRIASWLNHGEGGYRAHARPARRRPRDGAIPYPAGDRADEGAPPARHPEQGPARRTDARAAPRRRASCSRSTTAASSRASRTSTSTSCSSGRTTSSSSSATASPTSAITGVDLLAETGAELPRSADLGYGRCRLAAAVPTDAPYQVDRRPRRAARRDRPPEHRPAVLRGPQGIAVDVIPISGAVEVAPRLGLAEAIVDLVSTGSTLVDERPAPDRRRPRLGGGPRRQPDRASRSAPPSSTPSTRCSARSSPPAAAST